MKPHLKIDESITVNGVTDIKTILSRREIKKILKKF